MFIDTKDELLITKIIEKLRDSNKDISGLSEIRDSIQSLVDKDKFHLIDLIYQYLGSDASSLSAHSIFEGFIHGILQHLERDGKELVLIAIPVIFVGCTCLNRTPYYQAKKFDNNLNGINKIIENQIKDGVKGDDFNISLHDSLIDYGAFEGGVKRIRDLLGEIDTGSKTGEDSILNSNVDYSIDQDCMSDNLKFIVGVMEVDKSGENTHEILESINRVSINNKKIKDEFEGFLFRQKLSALSTVVGNPSLLIRALRDSLSYYNYLSNLNIISQVFTIEPSPHNIKAYIVISVKTGGVRVDLARKNDLDMIFYSVEIDYPIVNYEFELRQLEKIMRELGFDYEFDKE
jgi:hypothetical protein